MELQDAEGFVPTAPPRAPVPPDELLPRGQEYRTVGHLYRGIADGLRGLVDRFGERAVFVGSPRARPPPSWSPGPQLAEFTRQPFDIAAPQPVITDSLTLHVAELAGLGYETVLASATIAAVAAGGGRSPRAVRARDGAERVRRSAAGGSR